MRIYRGIAPKFFNGYSNCKQIKVKLAQELTSRQSLTDFIEEYYSEVSKE